MHIIHAMHAARKWTILLILGYSLLTIGVSYHSHPSGPQHTAKCQICQHSQLDQEQITVADHRAEDHDCGVQIIVPVSIPTVELQIQLNGRAPPSC